jgi:colicin import membrane protein
MPRPERSVTRGGWRAIALSLLLHALIVAAAVFGWFTWKHRPPPVQTLAIDATLVDERVLKGIASKPEPRPTVPEPTPPAPEPEPTPKPPEPEEQGPPKPDPAEIERQQEEEKQKQLEQEKLEQQKRDQEQKVEQEKIETEKKEADRLEAQRQAAAKAAADKTAAANAAADKAANEKKRADDEIAAKKAADEKARLARETELRKSLEAEERGNQLRNSSQMASWLAQIQARITRAWIKPPSAQPGIECIVSVTQVPGGEVTAVHVDSCTGGDAALRDSVEAAVLRASPLPPPPDPALFERNLELTFKPQ